jgi:hypothetical protein
MSIVHRIIQYYLCASVNAWGEMCYCYRIADRFSFLFIFEMSAVNQKNTNGLKYSSIESVRVNPLSQLPGASEE